VLHFEEQTMTWIYKNFIFKPKAKGFTSLGNPLRADPLFEKQLNNFSQLGWEYVQALSLNLGIFAPKEYLVVLKAPEGAGFDTLAEKVLNEAENKTKEDKGAL
jgi:hypothetical protein